MSITRKEMRVVPQRGNVLADFTAYKVYTLIAGCGDENLSPVAIRFGHVIHTENSGNVIDDKGAIRFVTMDFFREFKLDSGVIFQ